MFKICEIFKFYFKVYEINIIFTSKIIIFAICTIYLLKCRCNCRYIWIKFKKVDILLITLSTPKLPLVSNHYHKTYLLSYQMSIYLPKVIKGYHYENRVY